MASSPFSQFKKIQADVRSALREDGTIEDDAPLNRVQRFTHFWGLVGKFYWRNRCQVRASALAYTTLLAMVPLLAVSASLALALFHGPEGKAQLKGLVHKLVVSVAPSLGMTDADAASTNSVAAETGSNAANLSAPKAKGEITIKQDQVVDDIVDSIGNIKAGTIGATAMAGLLFAAISLLRTIERAFNDIWGVTRSRGWFWSVVLYWAVMTLGPMILSVAATSGYLKAITKESAVLNHVPLIGLLRSSLLPLVFLCLGFSLFYQLMPNTKVQFKSAVVGGAVAALLWHLNNQLAVLYNTRVVTYSKIYGSLGAIPLFLVGLYFSWNILLFGAQVAYVYQNRKAYLQEKRAEQVHQRGKEFAALRLMVEISRRFRVNQPPIGVAQMANMLGVPPRLSLNILQTLAHEHLLLEASGNDGSYVPARPLETISVRDVLEAMRTGQGRPLHTADDAVRALLRAEYATITEAETERSRSISMADLAAKLGTAETPQPAA